MSSQLSTRLLLAMRQASPAAIALAVVATIALGLGGLVASQAARSPIGIVASIAASALLLALLAGLPPSRPPASSRPVHLRWAPRAAVAGTALAVAFEGLALWCFGSERGAAGWTLHLLAVTVLAAAFVPWRGAAPAGARGRWATIAGVVAIAAAPRLHLLRSFPYGVWFDEAQNGLEALRILQDSSYRPVFVPGLSQMPALLFYYIAAFVATLGPEPIAVRLAITLLGILSVAAVWLLAEALYGPTVAWIAAVLLAICRWHVGFSRFGMAIVLPALFVPLVLWLALRSQQRQSPRDAVLAGVALGAGLQTYYSALAAPVLLLAWTVHGVVARQWRPRAAASLLALTFFAAALSYAPVLQYARHHPESFAQRLSTVSIVEASSLGELVELWRDPGRRDALLETLRSNAAKHLGMFHLEGDANGRHRILSLDFEAPQGARTAGITAAIALIAALPMAQAARAMSLPALPERARPALPAALVAGLLLYAAGVNWTTYFDRQRWDPAAWASYSTPETKIAEVIREYGGGATLYVPAPLRRRPHPGAPAREPARAADFRRLHPAPARGSRAGRPSLLRRQRSVYRRAHPSLLSERHAGAVRRAAARRFAGSAHAGPVLGLGARIPAGAAGRSLRPLVSR